MDVKQIKQMFLDYENIPNGEWSKFTKRINAYQYLTQKNFSDELDKAICDVCFSKIKSLKEKSLKKILVFCEKNNLENSLKEIQFEIGLYHEPNDESTDEEYRNTYTLQAFCGDSVIFCEKVF